MLLNKKRPRYYTTNSLKIMSYINMSPTEIAIDDFIAAYKNAHAENGILLQTEYSDEWPSTCCIGKPSQVSGQTLVEWEPVRQQPSLSFSDVEKSLGIEIDDQFKSLFSRYWSDNLNGRSSRGELQLLQIWNEEDGKRLQSNLIAHVLMKRRLKQRETLFFALTNEEDFTLSILNSSGEVVLEQVGCEPQEVIAPNLHTFLSSLTPVAMQAQSGE
jgi:SecY interacting protein Syd